jgi:iron complex outermembrane receptor protein
LDIRCRARLQGPRRGFARAFALLALLLAAGVTARAQTPSLQELAELSLEQLTRIEVTSVSKKAQPLGEAAASIFVITGDDIRRSGATSLPEALRLAPNLQVSQVSAGGYNIRARGINNNSANKLLVLIDGRSVYSPLFAGVFWDVQDVLLEDVDRIEVVSGPGATLWGVNSVNGTINVITRSAKNTTGGLLAATAGDRHAAGSARYGATSGGGGHYRVYGQYIDRDHGATAAGVAIKDALHKAQLGFRADWEHADDEVMVQGNVYRGLIGQPLPGSISISGADLALGPIPVSGLNLTARWNRRFSDGSEAMLQAYFDRTERTVPPTFGEKLNIVDLQFQHTVPLAAKHGLVWGAQLRYGDDHVTNSAIFGFLPGDLSQRWESLFGQTEHELRDDLRLTLGARLERNDYTGTEFLPTVRIAWKWAPEHLLWSAASRTVRAPSRLDRDAFVPSTPPFLLAGGPEVPAEVATVYELGFRGQPSSSLSYSLTLFHADYDRLHTQEIAPSRTFLTFAGQMEGKTRGVEMWGAWQATPAWRLAAGYTAQREWLRLKAGSNDAAAVGSAGRDPAHTWRLRSSLNLSRSVDLDLTVRGVAALSNPSVPGYATSDVRLGWKVAPGLELSLAALNLGDGGHGEFTGVDTRVEIGRTFHAGLIWHFDAH